MGNNDIYCLMLQSFNNLIYMGFWNDYYLIVMVVYEVIFFEIRIMGIIGNNLLIEGVGWWNVGMVFFCDVNNGYE